MESVSINVMRQEMTIHCKDGTDEMELRKKISDTVHKWEPHVEVSFGEQERTEGCHCDGSCCKTECTTEHDYEKAVHVHGEEGDTKKRFLRFGGGLVLFLLAFDFVFDAESNLYRFCSGSISVGGSVTVSLVPFYADFGFVGVKQGEGGVALEELEELY